MPNSQPHVRLRMTAVAVLEYDALLADYDTDDVAKIVKIDQETADDDLYMFLDNEDTEWDVKVEAITPDDSRTTNRFDAFTDEERNAIYDGLQAEADLDMEECPEFEQRVRVAIALINEVKPEAGWAIIEDDTSDA